MSQNTEPTFVSSWNEWDPLRHVIVGRADGTCIPATEPALDAKVPEDSDMRGQFGQRPKYTIDKDFIDPIAELGPHVAPLGITFYDNDLFQKVTSKHDLHPNRF